MILLEIFHPQNLPKSLLEKKALICGFIRGLSKLEYQVLSVEYNHPKANALLNKASGSPPPLMFIDQELVCSGNYPSIDELADMLKIGCIDSHPDCCKVICCSDQK